MTAKASITQNVRCSAGVEHHLEALIGAAAGHLSDHRQKLAHVVGGRELVRPCAIAKMITPKLSAAPRTATPSVLPSEREKISAAVALPRFDHSIVPGNHDHRGDVEQPHAVAHQRGPDAGEDQRGAGLEEDEGTPRRSG